MQALRILAFTTGALAVLATVGSAVRSVVLPRGVRAKLSRFVFRATRALFNLRAGSGNYARTDRVMALYAPVTLLVLVLVWESVVLTGYAAMYWALESISWGEAFTVSGSSLLTLGTAKAQTPFGTVLMFTEAGFGLLLLALLITFLPSLYAAFSRRENLVALLEVRAGSPPSAIEMILRFHRIHGLATLRDLWVRWEEWFADVEETHTSFPALVFFRSPLPNQSWVIAAGAVLDAASLRASTIDLPRQPEANLCIRAGFIALRRIASFYKIDFDADPKSDDPISISKDEFDEAYERLDKGKVPLKEREQAWRDFAGWRVNYDTVLIALAGFTVAPEAPWSSDRVGANFTLARTGATPKAR